MRLALLTLAAAILLAPLASAQKIDFKLDAIAAKASEKSEIDLDAALLKLALQHAGEQKDKDGKLVSNILKDVQEVHVRNYEFDKPGAYTDQDLDPIRKQASESTGWSRIINVREKNESTEVFVNMQGGKVAGCLIISAEAKELSVVHVMGPITLAQMKELVDSNIMYSLASATQAAPK